MSSLINRLDAAQTPQIDSNAKISVGEMYNASVNAGIPTGAETADNILAKQAMADCMMNLVISMESTNVYRDKNNIIHNKPIEHFYFCSQGGLTIGYGNKIECTNTGNLEKEGRALLEKTKIMRNGKELSMREKEAIVKNCYDRRTYLQTLKNKKKRINLNNLSSKNQKPHLFNKNDFCTIDSQSAMEISRLEYTNKNNKLVTSNSFFKDSYFLEALGTDFHYQFGDSGIKDTVVYKHAEKGLIPKKLYTGKAKAESDREKLRELICELAYETNQDKQKRKGQPATPESQSAFCINALQKFCKTFEDGIMKRQDHKTLLMEQYMTLVFAQSIKNVQNRDLTLAEVQRAQQMAHSLVYDELFHSETLQQVPDKIKPVTVVNSIKNLNQNLSLPKNMTSTKKNPFQMLRESLNKESETRIQSFNKKFKTDHSFEIPDNPVRDFTLAVNMQNGRW